MTVGEDVDLCWTVRKAGYDLLYVPFGSVAHKHRNSLFGMLRRRADYGTSEALLYRFHSDKRKTFHIRVLPVFTMAAIIVALMTLSLIPLIFLPLAVLAQSVKKARRMCRLGVVVPFTTVLYSLCRGHVSFFYFLTFHLVRYYLIPLLVLAYFVPPLWRAAAFLIGLASVVDYSVKRPRLDYGRFLLYYLLEHTFYQTGVFMGCLRQRAFGSYLPRFLWISKANSSKNKNS
jgi:cellulose synthase/poly-beta-1,6-N-acetylglucosamine synthase-like glycosyltransferase